MRGFVTSKGNRWYVVVELDRDESGRRQRKWHSGYATKREAERALPGIVQSLHNGTYVVPERTTLGEYLTKDWLPSVHSSLKSTTFDSYERTIQLHIEPRLGSTQLQKLTSGDLNRLYVTLSKEGRKNGTGGLSDRSVRLVHSILHKSLRDAVAWNLVARNVADAARPPRQSSATPNSFRVWSANEVHRFLIATKDERLSAAWTLFCTTGLRRGEVLGLRWQDVDLDGARLAVVNTLVSVAYQVEVSSPKSARSRRSVPLDSQTVSALRAHRVQHAKERLGWGSSFVDHDLVFAKENGEPLHPESVSRTFRSLVADAELPEIRLHDLRHTYATLSLQAGVQAKVVSERLGHATVAFTLDTYSHVLPSMHEESAQWMADLIFGTQA
jgi:integrase